MRRLWPKKTWQRALVLLGTLFVLFALALLAVGFMPVEVRTKLLAPAEDHRTAWYVALGDSYTAAPALKRQIAVTTPKNCYQSDANYPHIVAKQIKAPSLSDVSCSGAFIEHLTERQWASGATNAPQADALSAETKLVTVGLSGNDSLVLPNFFKCAGKPHDPGNPSNCVERFRTKTSDLFLDDVRKVEPEINSMLSLIAKRAPNAEVYVVGYPQITPSDGSDCPNEMPFTGADLAYLDEAIVLLNKQLRDAAVSHKMVYVDTHKPSVGLGVCAPRDRRWIESVVPTDPAFAMHPNKVGELGIAEAVLKAIARQNKLRAAERAKG